MARELNDRLHEAWALDAVASFHGVTGDFRTAIRLHEDALKIFRGLSDAFGELRTLNNLAVSLLEMKQYEYAYDVGDRSLQLARAYDLEMDICNNSCTVVDVLIEMKRYDDADELLRDAVSRTSHGSNVAHVNVLERAGRLRLLKGDLDGAEKYVARALEVAQKLDQRAEQALCHKTLSEIHEQKGDLVGALVNYKKFHEIHHAVQGEQAEKRLDVLKITHQVESAQYTAEIYRLEAVELQRKVEEQKAVQDVLEIQTTIDPLTELHNRRYFDDALLKEYSRHSRSGTEMSVLMLDVDHFKLYNDTYGHVKGDDCLRKITQVIRDSTSRPPDITARYGGEEFVCLLPETDLNGAKHVAENIRRKVAELGIPHVGSGVAMHVTVSIGVVSGQCLKDGAAIEFIVKADEQLYLAKSHGRNRVETIRIDPL
jgi:diguanylate cyclase (GGDEF)-like protein